MIILPGQTSGWIVSPDPDAEPQDITMPNPPDEILKLYASPRPLRFRRNANEPPQEGGKQKD